MEAAVAAGAFYTIETAVEAGVAGYYLSKPTLPLQGHLEHVTTTNGVTLPRYGHTTSVISDRAYIFGGLENAKNEAINNDMHELHISTEEKSTTAVLRSIPAIGEGVKGTTPSARACHSASVARNLIFIFGGCDGSPEDTNSKPLEENGRLWVFDPLSSTWTFLDPPPDTTFPFSRMDHASASSPDGSTVFIHGGVSTDQTCLNDTWAFYLDEGKWTRLPDAPGPARYGSSLTCGQAKLWRFGGRSEAEDGASTLHRSIDFVEYPTGGTLEDVKQALIRGNVNNSTQDSQWETEDFLTDEPSSDAPPPLHSAAVHYITTGNGRDYLLLALGSTSTPSFSASTPTTPDPQDLHTEIWIYQLPPTPYSSARLKDSIREALPKVQSHRGEWSRLQISGMEVGADEDKGGAWTGRSRSGSAMTGTKQVMIWGGIGPRGETLGDGWRVIID